MAPRPTPTQGLTGYANAGSHGYANAPEPTGNADAGAYGKHSTPEPTTMPTKASTPEPTDDADAYASTLEPTATPTTASTLEPTTTTTPTATPTPTPEEAAAARLSTIIPWFDSPPDSAHSSARETLVSLWLRDANLGDAVARMPWIADGATPVESFVLGTIDGIAMFDPELGNLLATYEWFTAGLNDDEWASVIEPLFQIVARDSEFARRMAASPMGGRRSQQRRDVSTWFHTHDIRQ